jgi:hypothetical protein
LPHYSLIHGYTKWHKSFIKKEIIVLKPKRTIHHTIEVNTSQ